MKNATTKQMTYRGETNNIMIFTTEAAAVAAAKASWISATVCAFGTRWAVVSMSASYDWREALEDGLCRERRRR
jgi:hypothetical protein